MCKLVRMYHLIFFRTIESDQVDVAKQRRDFLHKIIDVQLTFMASVGWFEFTYVIKHTLSTSNFCFSLD